MYPSLPLLYRQPVRVKDESETSAPLQYDLEHWGQQVKCIRVYDQLFERHGCWKSEKMEIHRMT